MVFRVLISVCLFRTNGKKDHLEKSDSRHYYGNFFASAILKVT